MEETKTAQIENIEEQQLTATTEFHELVSAEDGEMFTTSLMVATRFGKNHKDVLRAIENLECSPEFNERNFAPVSYVDAKGEKRPAFHLTRDGFSFLAMGFTGSKAAAWKEKFLEAFNAMEDALRTKMLSQHKTSMKGAAATSPLQPRKTSPLQPRKKCTKKQLAVLHDFITLWCYIEGCTEDDAQNLLQTALRIPTLDELQQTAFDKAAGLAWHFIFQKSDFSGVVASTGAQNVLKAIMRLWEFYGKRCAIRDIEEHICGVCKASNLSSLSEADTRKAIFAAFMCFVAELPPE